MNFLSNEEIQNRFQKKSEEYINLVKVVSPLIQNLKSIEIELENLSEEMQKRGLEIEENR